MNIFGIIGVILGISYGLPQLFKVIKTKDVSGLSLMTYLLLDAMILCYLIYAIQIEDTIFIISNTVPLLINGVILALIIKGGSNEGLR